MVDETLNIGNASKSEEGEYLCGKCFCLGAIIKSGLLDRYRSEVSSIMDQFVKLANERSYLKIIAYKYIVEYINTVGQFFV